MFSEPANGQGSLVSRLAEITPASRQQSNKKLRDQNHGNTLF